MRERLTASRMLLRILSRVANPGIPRGEAELRSGRYAGCVESAKRAESTRSTDEPHAQSRKTFNNLESHPANIAASRPKVN